MESEMNKVNEYQIYLDMVKKYLELNKKNDY